MMTNHAIPTQRRGLRLLLRLPRMRGRRMMMPTENMNNEESFIVNWMKSVRNVAVGTLRLVLLPPTGKSIGDTYNSVGTERIRDGIPLIQYDLRRSLGRKNKPVRKTSKAWARAKN